MDRLSRRNAVTEAGRFRVAHGGGGTAVPASSGNREKIGWPQKKIAPAANGKIRPGIGRGWWSDHDQSGQYER